MMKKKTIPYQSKPDFSRLKKALENLNSAPILEWNNKEQDAPDTIMEETMNTTTTNTNTDLVLRARQSLINALWSVTQDYDSNMTKKYGLKDEDLPKNAEELISKIKEGKFKAPDTNDDDYDEDDYRWSPYFGIKFRDPAMKKDREGYEKTMEAFREEKSAIELKVAVLDPTEALKSVESFKAKYTVH